MNRQDKSLNLCILESELNIIKLKCSRSQNRGFKLQSYIESLKSVIEKQLGFSLNDDEAKFKLDHLSDTIKIPPVLYQLVS